MTQTAVEWLKNELNERCDIIGNESSITDIFEQAKAMEKEQKGYSKEEVDNLLYKLLENNMCSHAGDKLIEQYYNETFKSE